MSSHNDQTYRRSSSHERRGRAKQSAVASPSWVKWAVLGFVAVLVLLVGVDIAASAGRIHPGVTVSGVKVGGMNASRAALTLELQLPEKSKAPVTVAYEDKEWTVAPEDLSVSFDYDALVAQAMSVGRSGGVLQSVGQRMQAWSGSSDLPARATVDPEKLNALLGEISSRTNVAPRDAKVKFDGTEANVTASKSGMAVDRSQLATAILTAFTSSDRRIEPRVGVAQADVSDQAAQAAQAAALQMIAEPATVTWGEKKKWELTTEDLAGMIDFRKVQEAQSGRWRLEPYVSQKKTSKTIKPMLGGKIGHPARDAGFRTRSGSVSIVPSKTGVGPDIEMLAANLTTALSAAPGQPRVVELRTRKTQPKITTADARAMQIKKRISTFTTEYVAGNRPRVKNIHRLGDALDGKLVKPGGTFSFNNAIGERTAAKGYVEAPAIVDGKLVPQLGGGICQVGTTLFNSVFMSGLPITERRNHSFYISHYPTGRDATVSWGGPDLKFKNDTGGWLLISVSYTSGSITISLYGTDPGYKVSWKTGPFTNERPYPIEKTKDPKLEKGRKVIEDPGVKGKTVVVKRTVKKDGEVVRVDTFKSVYRPKSEIVRVGTKTTESKETTGKSN